MALQQKPNHSFRYWKPTYTFLSISGAFQSMPLGLVPDSSSCTQGCHQWLLFCATFTTRLHSVIHMPLPKCVHKALTKPLATKQCKNKNKCTGAIQPQRNIKMWQQSSRIMQPQRIQPTLLYDTWSDYLFKTGGSLRTGASLHQELILQEPLPCSSLCTHRDSSTHSPPEVTSSELGWGALAGQCGEACIAAALAIPVLWRNRGLNFQGCQTAPSTLQVTEKEMNLKMPDLSKYILGCSEELPVPTEVFGLLSHLAGAPFAASWILWFMSWWCSCQLPM